MKTNLLGSEENGTFKLVKEQLIQQTSQEVTYTIEKVDEISLVLTMTIRDINFRLTMAKNKLSDAPK